MPAFGGETISPRCPLPIGVIRSISRIDRSPAVRLQLDALLRVARAQVVEGDAVLGLLRIVAVDLLDLQQREVALALLGRADLAHHRVAGAQVEALDLDGLT